jgi:hypothetical protein
VSPAGRHPATLAAAIAKQSLMKPTDFHIGLEFFGRAGFRWRCTDVGTRTILAIRLDPDDDPNWHRGPPYIAEETVFDEVGLERCHLTHDDALRAAIHEADTSGHPGYPHEVVLEMLDASREDRYPHQGVLRFDRRARSLRRSASYTAISCLSPRCRTGYSLMKSMMALLVSSGWVQITPCGAPSTATSE